MTKGMYTDIYVLTQDRSVNAIESFLNHFLPDRDEHATEYEIPQYAKKPEKIFNSAAQLMDYCHKNPSAEHTIYWSNTGTGEPKYAIVQYTSDDACVLGLSVNDEDLAPQFLERLKNLTSGKYGYMAVESPPPSTKKEFMETLNNSDNSI
jgi:hypothetical protein